MGPSHGYVSLREDNICHVFPPFLSEVSPLWTVCTEAGKSVRVVGFCRTVVVGIKCPYSSREVEGPEGRVLSIGVDLVLFL